MTTLREARKAKGLNLREAAGQMGVHLSALQKWETGKRQVPVSSVSAIERVLGMDRILLRPDVFDREHAEAAQ